VDVGFDPFHRAYGGGGDGIRRLEGGVRVSRGEVFVEHGEETAVMRAGPVTSRALALHDNAIDRGEGALQVGDRRQIRPTETAFVSLLKRRTDEQLVLAELRGEVRQSRCDRAVQEADGLECLAARYQFVRGHLGERRPNRLETVAV